MTRNLTTNSAFIDWKAMDSRTQTLPRIDLHRTRQAAQSQARRAAARDAVLLIVSILWIVGAAIPLTAAAVHAGVKLVAARRTQAAAVKKMTLFTAQTKQLDDQMAGLTASARQGQTRQIWAGTLRSLARCAPTGLTFERVQISGKMGRLEITLSGHADTVPQVTQFSGALARSPGFSEVHLTQTDADPSAIESSVRFALTARAGAAK